MKARRPVKRRLWVEELEARLVLSTTAVSSNWSGYAALPTTGLVNSARASWFVPTVSGTGTSYSSVWVGIDGFNSGTVEQIGIDADLVNGVPQYYAWFEMYPAYPVNLSMTIHPGDKIDASVAASTTGEFTLSLTATPKGGGGGQSFTTKQTLHGAARSSAEWVVEAPSSFFGVLPLAPFSPVTFSGASFAVDGGTSGPISSAPNVQITMANPSGAKATPSNLDSTGTSFTVTFSAPAPAPTPPPRRRHHFFQNNTGTAPTAASSGVSSATTPSAVALAAVLVNEAPPQVLPGLPVTPAQVTAPTPAPAVASPALPSSFGLAGALPGRSASADTLDGGGGDQAPVADSAPAADQPGTPSPRLAPDANPDAAPAPMPTPAPDDSRGQLEGTAVALGQAPDAAPVELPWEPAARLEGVRAWVGRVEEEGTTFEAGASVAFALALGGSWGVAAEEAEGRRRRQRQRPF
jgi:hypothetical protein